MKLSGKNKDKKDKTKIINEKPIDFDNKYIYCKYDKENNNLNNLYSKEINPEKVYIVNKKNYEDVIKNLKLNSNKKIDLLFYSSKEEIIKLISNRIEFVVLKEIFIKDIDKFAKFKNKKHVDIYKDKDIFFLLLEKNQILKLKHLHKENNEIKEDKNKSNLIGIKASDNYELIIKKLILLYAFEKEFYKIITKSIEDEYDFKNYLLINKNIIDKFKQKYDYLKIKEILDKNKNNLSYKGYLKNISEFIKNNEIMNIIKINLNQNSDTKIFEDENNFIPKINKISDSFQYPYDFIIFPKTLFDLFYDDFNHSKKQFEDFRYNILIGDNLLFIQDSKYKNIFHTYKFIVNDNENNNLDMVCSFKYDNELMFYEEVENHIKGKGLENYLNERKLEIKNELNQNIDLISNNKKIGECLVYKQIKIEIINENIIEDEVTKSEKFINKYNDLIKEIKNLESSNLNISNINEIENNINNLKIIKGFIIFEPILKYILDDLFNFPQIEKLKSLPMDENYIQQKNEIIKNILSHSKTNEYNEPVKPLGEKDFSEMMNLKIFLSFINIDLMNAINKQEDIDKEFWLFKNNDLYFAYCKYSKRLFKLNFDSDNKFTITEPFNKNKPENILIYLKKLVNDEETKSNLIKTKLKNITKFEYYYLVNQEWIEQFKLFYNYKKIKKNINSGDDKLQKYLKNLSELPQELSDSQRLIPEPFIFQYIQGIIPNKIQIINKELFESICKEIISNKNSISECIYKVAFADNKIFIQSNSSQQLYYIYSMINSYYVIDSIINLNNLDGLTNLLNTSENNQTLEEFLLNKYNIDFSNINPQILLDENLNNFGDFYNMKIRNDIIKDEPNHTLGLQNIGATCYMNATIQCLCHIRNIKNYFLNRQKVYEDINNKNCPLTFEFYKVINNLWKKSFGGKKYYTPTDFKEIISQMNPLFQGIAANDSKDLIIFLFETMHSEINKPEYQNYQTENILNNQELSAFRNDYYSKNNSLFSRTFYFEQQGELKCLNCQYHKLSYTIYNIIIFPLEKVREYMVKTHPNGFFSVNLEDCFEHYQENEILFGSNQIYCNCCNQMANASNGNKLFTAPDVMTIVLNRGKGLEFDVNFEYPLRINIDKFILDKNCINNDYELICVLTHIGPSGMAGHFIAICKSLNDNKWYIYNDAQVDECIDPRNTNNKIIEGLPYVLFYQRFDRNLNKNNENIQPNEINKNNIPPNGNMLTLYFNYNDKEFYIDIDKSSTVKQIIKDLSKKYGIKKNSSLYMTEGNQFNRLDDKKKIKDFPNIKNETKLTILDNE